MSPTISFMATQLIQLLEGHFISCKGYEKDQFVEEIRHASNEVVNWINAKIEDKNKSLGPTL